jgi:hypothetical protein
VTITIFGEVGAGFLGQFLTDEGFAETVLSDALWIILITR